MEELHHFTEKLCARTSVVSRKRKSNLSQDQVSNAIPTGNISSSDDEEVPYRKVNNEYLQSKTLPKREKNLIISNFVFHDLTDSPASSCSKTLPRKQKDFIASGFIFHNITDSPQQSQGSQLQDDTVETSQFSKDKLKFSNFTTIGAHIDKDVSHGGNQSGRQCSERKKFSTKCKDIATSCNVNKRGHEDEKTLTRGFVLNNIESGSQYSRNELNEFINRCLYDTSNNLHPSDKQEIANYIWEKYELKKQSNSNSKRNLKLSSSRTACDKPKLKSQSHKSNESLNAPKQNVKNGWSLCTGNNIKFHTDSDITSNSDAVYKNKEGKVKGVDVSSSLLASEPSLYKGKILSTTQRSSESKEKNLRNVLQLSNCKEKKILVVSTNTNSNSNTESDSDYDHRSSMMPRNTKVKLAVSTKQYNKRHKNYVNLQKKDMKASNKSNSSVDSFDDELCNLATPDAIPPDVTDSVPLEDTNIYNPESKFKKFQTTKSSYIKNLSIIQESDVNALPSTSYSSNDAYNRKIYYSADIQKMFLVNKTVHQPSTVKALENVAERTRNKASGTLGKENHRKVRRISSSAESSSSPEEVKSTTKRRTSVLNKVSDTAPKKVKRKPKKYDDWERQKIIDFIVKYKAYPIWKGNTLWKRMEKKKVCCGRTWQSLKEHFRKTILPNIEKHSLSKDVLNEFLKLRCNDTNVDKSACVGILSSSGNDSEPLSSDNESLRNQKSKKKVKSTFSSNVLCGPTAKECNVFMFGKKGWRKNGIYYTPADDKTIIKYVLRHMSTNSVKGNRLWKNLEASRILFGRTYHSLKERFLKVIMPRLDNYEVSDSVAQSLSKACDTTTPKKKKKSTALAFPTDELAYSSDNTPVKKTSKSRNQTNYYNSDIIPGVDENIDNLPSSDTDTSAPVYKQLRIKRKLYTVRNSILDENKSSSNVCARRGVNSSHGGNRKLNIASVPKKTNSKNAKEKNKYSPNTKNVETETNIELPEISIVNSVTQNNLIETNVDSNTATSPHSSKQIVSGEHNNTKNNGSCNFYENKSLVSEIRNEPQNIVDEDSNNENSITENNVAAYNDHSKIIGEEIEITIEKESNNTLENDHELRDNVRSDIDELEAKDDILTPNREFCKDIDVENGKLSARKSTECCEAQAKERKTRKNYKGNDLKKNNVKETVENYVAREEIVYEYSVPDCNEEVNSHCELELICDSSDSSNSSLQSEINTHDQNEKVQTESNEEPKKFNEVHQGESDRNKTVEQDLLSIVNESETFPEVSSSMVICKGINQKILLQDDINSLHHHSNDTVENESSI